ncbi:diacylglycerol kinase family protein [bacterium]|nr:diacylglycerol kinase family protein [bacterium]
MFEFRSKDIKSSFKHALDGLALIYKSQRNIKIQLLIALFTVLMAILLEFNHIEYLILFVLITLVLFAEMVNTVIEFILDSLYKHNYSQIAKIAKDMSAGMVLFVTVMVVISGLVLFINKYLSFINSQELILWY